MKRMIGVFTLSIVMFSFTELEIKGYMTLFEDSSSAKYFKYGKSYYVESFDNKKEIIADKEYYVEYRKYGWGEIDTSYYRKGDDNYYHINKKTMEESIVLPVNPKLGDNWTENDKSWSYEVVAEDENFKTPVKKYKNCIKVHCKQLIDIDKEKSKEYFLYHSPEFGYVGNVDSKGNILSYLSEVKLNAKVGDKIGEK